MTRAGLDRRPADIAAMFDALAGRYDVMNTLMTFGQERRWRAVVRRELAAAAGERVLDLATGTGVSADGYAAAGADVVACDFSFAMMRAGRARRPAVRFVAGDALALPFADCAFDAATVCFGLRNVADVDAALGELLRVTRTGGRLLVLETSAPAAAPLRAVHAAYLRHGMPALARLVARNPAAYRYLAESSLSWPAPGELAGRLAAAGWVDVGWRALSLGAVALHRGRRPAGAGQVTAVRAAPRR